MFVPYVFYERLKNVGSTSHLGDVQVALTKTAVQEGDLLPELLLTGRWKTETGKSTGRLPTGSRDRGEEARREQEQGASDTGASVQLGA